MILYGVLYQKGNRRVIFRTKSGKTLCIKSVKAQKTVADFERQIKAQWKDAAITKPCILIAHIYYPNRRHDLEASLLCDILQKAGVIQNDRLVERMALTKGLDPKNPRVELSIEVLDKSLCAG